MPYQIIKFWRLRSSRLWWLCILLFMAFLTVSWLAFRVAHNSVNEQIEQQALPLTSDNVYSQIQQDLLRPIFIASLMSHDTFVKDWAIKGHRDDPAMVRYLAAIRERFGTTVTFFASDRDGRYYDYKNSRHVLDLNDQENSWYQRVKQLPADETYRITTGRDPERPGHLDIFIDHKVFNYQNKFLGVIGVGLSVTELKELIERYQQRYQRRIYFVDREGKLMLHGSRYQDRRSLNERPEFKTILPKLLSSPSGSYLYHDNGTPVYLNARLIPEFNWYLVVEQHEHHAVKDILHIFILNIVISLMVTVVLLVVLRATIGRYQHQLEEMASTDKLTGVLNRQILPLLFSQMQSQQERQGGALAVLMFDIDFFKQVNDEHGHLVGDMVLKGVAKRLRDDLRKQDLICRWGGEEFLVILYDCHAQDAQRIADKLLAIIRERPFSDDLVSLNVTLSGGGTLIRDSEPLAHAVERADEALYDAKRSGRDRFHWIV